MKKIVVLVVSVCALVGLGSASSVASASNGTQTTHFTAVYGQFTCAGERIVKTAPKAFVKDSETCLDSSGTGDLPAGTYDFSGLWASDYEYFTFGTFRIAVSATIVVTDNGDGTTTWNIVAYY